MVLQEDEWSCGPACVRQILLDQGIDVPEARVRAMTDYVAGEGTSAGSLARALAELNVARRYQGGVIFPDRWDRLIANAPFIAQVRPGRSRHWVIVDAMEGDLVLIRDPAGMPDVEPTCGAEGKVEKAVFDWLWKLGAYQVVTVRTGTSGAE